MSLFVTRPLLKTGLACVSSLLLFTAFAKAQNQNESFTISEPLLTLSAGQSFALQNFNPNFGTLSDVTLTMKIQGKTITIFDANNPANDWVNLMLTTPGGSTKVNGANVAVWGNSPGNLDVDYARPAGKSVQAMGIAGLMLYCTPKNAAAQYIDVNYTYDLGDPNSGNGVPPATPEPAVKYLSAIAAGAMLLLLVRRNLRQRAVVLS